MLALDTDAIDANFDGNVSTKPAFSAEGDLTAKSHSMPSLLAWMRKQPPAETAVGNGELSSHIAWQTDEITFSHARFALSHATGQGQAVVTLKSPRPHLRAALALETLDLNPFSRRNGATAAPQAPSEPAPPRDGERCRLPSRRLPPAPERRATMSAPRRQGAEAQGASAAAVAGSAQHRRQIAACCRRTSRRQPSTPTSMSMCTRRRSCT